MPEPLPIDVNAFGLYIYLWGFFSMVHLPSAMVSTGKWNHRPPFTDPSLREVPIGGYFLHSWPAYPADSTSLGRYRPSVRMASGNAILAPSLSVITFYESYYTGSHYGAQPAPTPFGSGACRFSFLCRMV